MHLFYGTSTHSPWAAENLFFGSIWLSFLGVNLPLKSTLTCISVSESLTYSSLTHTLTYYPLAVNFIGILQSATALQVHHSMYVHPHVLITGETRQLLTFAQPRPYLQIYLQCMLSIMDLRYACMQTLVVFKGLFIDHWLPCY